MPGLVKFRVNVSMSTGEQLTIVHEEPAGKLLGEAFADSVRVAFEKAELTFDRGQVDMILVHRQS